MNRVLMYTHTSTSGRASKTVYYIEQGANGTPCVVTYVNGVRADVREVVS
jgi:hypothetical protein